MTLLSVIVRRIQWILLLFLNTCNRVNLMYVIIFFKKYKTKLNLRFYGPWRTWVDNAQLYLLDLGSRGAMQYVSRLGGKPNVRPSVFNSQARFILILSIIPVECTFYSRESHSRTASWQTFVLTPLHLPLFKK